MNMANAYQVGLKNSTKAEEMYRQALDGHEKSLGKDHDHVKNCARNLARLFQASAMISRLKTTELVQLFHHLMGEPWVVSML